MLCDYCDEVIVDDECKYGYDRMYDTEYHVHYYCEDSFTNEYNLGFCDHCDYMVHLDSDVITDGNHTQCAEEYFEHQVQSITGGYYANYHIDAVNTALDRGWDMGEHISALIRLNILERWNGSDEAKSKTSFKVFLTHPSFWLTEEENKRWFA